MKKLTKLLCLTLAVMFCAMSFVACGSDKTDYEYIKEKGELVIGITYFEPMNYVGADGQLTGFETEFATAVCEILGVKPKFQEINWKTKEVELNGKTIDCIWNGMTITEDRKASMSISNAYMKNKQVIVLKSENIGKYKTADDFKGIKLVAEAESAGESVAKTNALFTQAAFTPVKSMKDAIMEVAAGTADACVVDFVTSIGMIGEGTAYAALSVDTAFSFDEEEYGIAFRKDSDITAKVNEAIATLIANGTLAKIAAKYKLDGQLIG